MMDSLDAQAPSQTAALTTEQIKRRIDELGPWFHNMELGNVQTAPDHYLGNYPANKWQRFADAIPADLHGRTVLDVGCNAGFYSMEMKKRGADRVVGIDSDPDYIAQARFAAEVCGVEIEWRVLSVYDVAALGERFDIVLFMGLLYHLRHPLLALDLLHEHAVKDLLVFQSLLRGDNQVEPVDDDYPFWETKAFARASFPRLHFIEKRFAGDSTNWWVPNRAGAEAMLRSAGFRIMAHPEEEVFICQRIERDSEPGAVYPAGRSARP